MAARKPNTAVLVLMPFASAITDVYEHGIRAACEMAGMRCSRIEEQTFGGTILARIYDEIARADFIVSDLTDLNPNVFYETGYAHAIGKHVILLTARGGKIPFDLGQYQHVFYDSDMSRLALELSARLTWCSENVASKLTGFGPLFPGSAICMSAQTSKSQLTHQVPKGWGCRSLYLGIDGAKNWLELSDAPQYHRAKYYQKVVTDLLAKDFLKDVSVGALISLGVGNGLTDRTICSQLKKKQKLSYVPIDINPYLLSTAIEIVGPVAPTAFGLVCDFEEEMLGFIKPRLTQLRPCPRLFSLLGYTVCNIDGPEDAFLWDLSELMSVGDYLLLDFLAIDDKWEYSVWRHAWHTEWDGPMRRLLCDGYSKRVREGSAELQSTFESRFAFAMARSEVPGSAATYIADSQLGGRVVTNLRRYAGLGEWMRKTFPFKALKQRVVIEAQGAGRGYLLVQKVE